VRVLRGEPTTANIALADVYAAALSALKRDG
jgi:hypothetical protein